VIGRKTSGFGRKTAVPAAETNGGHAIVAGKKQQGTAVTCSALYWNEV